MVNQVLHRARFAHIDEVWPLLASSFPFVGVLLGSRRFLWSKRLVTVRSTKHRPELGNLLIVAPTRSGKGLLAVSQLLTWHHSVIVNDIKGELFAQTAGFRSLLGPVYVLDPTGIGHAYDPLQGKTTEDALYSRAAQLLYQTEEKDQIFTQRAITMLACIFAAAKQEGVAALPYTRVMLRAGLAGCVERLQSVSPELATVFLDWKEQDLLALSPLVRLLWGSLIDELVSTYDARAGKGCQPVMLLIDEAGRTAIPSLAEHATTVVGRGISIWLAVQSLSQLEVVYGRARAQVLRDNMESQLYYRPTDIATAKYVEERCGRRSAYAHHTNSQQGGQASEGRSEQGIPLLSAYDFQRYNDDEVIGFHRALPPFKLERMDWRQYPMLQKRRSVRAPKLAILPEGSDLPVKHGLERSHYIDPDR